MSAVQDELDIVVTDHRAGPRDSREAIRVAILAAAADRTNRNGTKRADVRRLAKPIPPEALQ